MTREIDNMQDVIDSRDIIERIEELEVSQWTMMASLTSFGHRRA